MASLRTALVAAAALMCGSASAQSYGYGRISESGFSHNTLHYRVDFREPAAAAFLSDDWRLANYTAKADVSSVQFVREADSKVDLVFEHREHNGVLTIDSFRLPERMAGKRLDVILRNIAENMSGSGGYSRYDADDDEVRTRTREYATVLKEVGELQIGGQTAAVGTIEVANLAQLRMDANHRNCIIRIAILKAPVRVFHRNRKVEGEEPMSDQGIVAIIYSNSLTDFEAGRSTFRAVLDLIQVPGNEDDARDRTVVASGDVIYDKRRGADKAVLQGREGGTAVVGMVGGGSQSGEVVSWDGTSLILRTGDGTLHAVHLTQILQVQWVARAVVASQPVAPASTPPPAAPRGELLWRGGHLVSLESAKDRRVLVTLDDDTTVQGVLVGVSTDKLVVRDSTGKLRILDGPSLATVHAQK